MTTTTEKEEARADAFAPLTAQLNNKFIANYFKKTTTRVHAQRTEHYQLLTDSVVCVRVSHYTNVAPSDFPQIWKMAIWPSPKEAPVEAGPDLEAKWKFWDALEVEHVLMLTHQLLEVPSSTKGKPGLLFRKFLAGDTPVYLDKRVMDMLSPDLDELKDFRFEQLNGDRGVVRVTVRYNVVYVMPCTLRKA